MTTAPLAHTDTLVLDYLAALWAQSEDLDPGLRDDLMTTVADYIAVRRRTLDDPAEIIRRLGPPESLVAACHRGSIPVHLKLPALVVPPPAPVPVTTSGGAVEFASVGLLTAGALVLPGLAPVAGMLLATGSSYWTPAQKTVAWTLTVGSGAVGLALALLVASVPASAAVAMFLLYVTASAGSLLTGMMLLNSLRRHPPG
nr:hypothetical protein [uncultured Actinoplanes sp.]